MDWIAIFIGTSWLWLSVLSCKKFSICKPFTASPQSVSFLKHRTYQRITMMNICIYFNLVHRWQFFGDWTHKKKIIYEEEPGTKTKSLEEEPGTKKQQWIMLDLRSKTLSAIRFAMSSHLYLSHIGRLNKISNTSWCLVYTTLYTHNYAWGVLFASFEYLLKRHIGSNGWVHWTLLPTSNVKPSCENETRTKPQWDLAKL